MASLRLCESDYQLLQQTCRESNLDRSTLLRQLIRLRVVMADEGFWGYAEGFTDSQDRVIMVDRMAIMQASREMVRWGNHYNQAVHALNTIALHFTRGRNLNEQWLTEQIQEIRLQL